MNRTNCESIPVKNRNFIRGIHSFLFSSRIFNRLMLSYFLIVIAVFIILSCIFIVSNKQIITNQTINYNKQYLKLLNNYIDTKYKQLKEYNSLFHANDVTAQNQNGFLSDYLNGTLQENSSEYNQALNDIRSFITKNIFSRSKDIENVILFRTRDLKHLAYRRGNRSMLNFEDLASREILKVWEDGTIHDPVFYVPAINTGDTKPIYTMYIFDVIRTPEDYTKPIGLIALGINSEYFKTAYEYFDDYVKGDTIIFDKNGKVLFDTSEDYYGKEYKYSQAIINAKEDVLHIDNSQFTICRGNRFDFVAVNCISYADLYSDVNKTIGIMLILVILSILLIVGITYFRTRGFSQRMTFLLDGIAKVRNGDLSSKIQIERGGDEISEIASNINIMQDKLGEYINRVYVTEMKRKEAELYALQSQVNPHFLYNSLEVLRMYALQSGNTDISRMIHSLAELFRRTIKDEPIVTVRDEVEYCRNFLDFYNSRYQGRITSVISLDAKTGKEYMLKHLLQPILENIFIHGIEPDKDEIIVNIECREDDKDISVSVADNGKGIDAQRLAGIVDSFENTNHHDQSGIGLLNVHSRIRIVYGPEYGVSIQNGVVNGTSVTIRFAKKSREDLLAYVQSHDRG